MRVLRAIRVVGGRSAAACGEVREGASEGSCGGAPSFMGKRALTGQEGVSAREFVSVGSMGNVEVQMEQGLGFARRGKSCGKINRPGTGSGGFGGGIARRRKERGVAWAACWRVGNL